MLGYLNADSPFDGSGWIINTRILWKSARDLLQSKVVSSAGNEVGDTKLRKFMMISTCLKQYQNVEDC